MEVTIIIAEALDVYKRQAILDPVTNPVLTVAPQNKEDTKMSGATNRCV